MSGSDPSTRRSQGPGDGAGDDFACPVAPFTTVLGTPSPDVVGDLSVGDLLDVVPVENPARGVAAVTLAGDRVGAVTQQILPLRHCMLNEDNVYEGEVLAVAGGSVSIEVRLQ